MSIKHFLSLIVVLIILGSCKDKKVEGSIDVVQVNSTRQLKDTIGFTQYKWQLDSVMARIDPEDKLPSKDIYKAVICPHDDYAYAAGLYNKTLAGIKAKTIIMIGVAHRARNYSLENKLIFGTFKQWKSTNGQIPVSNLMGKIMTKLPETSYVVHDSMMQLEHSLEAITPFLQKNIEQLEIIPILIPYITFDTMNLISTQLSSAVHQVMKDEHLDYGNDIAIVISNDAIHYGSEGWGSSNLAPFGVDDAGTEKARQKDLDIINECLIGDLGMEKIKLFNRYTVKEDDFKEYQWTWCGRYSLPFGLLLSNKLNMLTVNKPLSGSLIDHRSSFHNPHIEVTDLQMGHTAPANQEHWVAYVGVSYN